MNIKSAALVFVLIFVLFPGVTANSKDARRSQSLPTTQPNSSYMMDIQVHVTTHWAYKKTLDNQFYSVQVDLTLNRDGSILDKKILKLSPDDEYNTYALKALVEMQPYPPIPAELESDTMSVRFHLMPNK